ncbi:MAG TPA: glycosyltransferase [Terriglobales bacterium]|nr:glycosyltransferase [Terriglobales bacterium]
MTGSEIPVGRSRPLHVLTITPFYPKAGNESGGCFVAEPLAELAKTGVQSTVYAVEPFYRPRARKIASDANATWFRYAALPGGLGLSSAGRGLFLRLRRPAERLHTLTPIDVIHAHGALPCGDAALRLSEMLGIPFVVTVHGLDAFSTKQVAGWAGALCEKVSRRVYRAARRVIGVSQHVCDEVQRGTDGLAASASKVVYNGVDSLLFALGVDSDPTPDPEQAVVLTVGNLIPTKGHELLLRSLAALRPEFSALTWEVIGDGPELNRIRELAERLGLMANIRFRGRQNRATVAEAFRRCTVFALPSSYEGLGCVYLEAMASGKAAIGCLGQGIEEVIRHGENGWLIRADAGEELMEGLCVLLRDASRRARIGKAARDTILQSFTLAHQARELRAVYEESIR